MTNPRKKQFIYGFIYLIILILIGYGVYLTIKPAPSCFDHIQDGNETGVDCGGSCPPCLPSSSALSFIGYPQILVVNTTTISILARIQNTSSDFGASNFSYNYVVYDSNNKVLASSTGYSFIYPTQIKYIFIPVISVPNANQVSYAQINVGSINWLSQDKFNNSDSLSVTNLVTTSTDSNVSVSGDIFNNGPFNIKKANVLALFYNNLGLIAGASYTEVDNISSLSHQSFTIIHPLINNINNLATKVYIYVQPL
jgi:hypothetical protein